MRFRGYFFSYAYLSIFLLSIFTNWYAYLIIPMSIMALGMILYKIGRGIVLMETMAFLYVFTCLLMPLIGYEYYPYDNALSRLWVKYMLVKSDVYFGFAIPAVSIFCFAITLPALNRRNEDSGEVVKARLASIRQILANQQIKSGWIIGLGVFSSVVGKFLPPSLSYVGSLIYFSSFAGLLYVFFAPANKYRLLIITLFSLFVLLSAILSGMFTIVVYMGVTIFSFFMVGRKIPMLRKTLVMILLLSIAVILQNVKGVYRIKTWKGDYSGNKLELFSTLFVDKASKGTALLEKDALFPLYSRTNQGLNIALVMKRIPRVKPYDGGDRLVTVVASAFVPRFIWPDKPEAGGKFNMRYYAGKTIVNWSTNVGPLGEAYGSFGVSGGILYMFLLGLAIRWSYIRVYAISNKIPLLICWLPVLFYQVVYSAEADTLQIINSEVKAAAFIWILYKLFPIVFGVIRKKRRGNFSLPYMPAQLDHQITVNE